MALPQVTDIVLYPVKGAQGVSVKSAIVTDGGLTGDRTFAVLKDGKRCGQKDVEALKYLGARWQGENLELSFPDRPGFLLKPDAAAETVVEDFRTREIPLHDMGDPVADWLSEAFDCPVRLGRQSEPTDWFIPLPEFDSVHGNPQTRFIDAAPILLTSEDSLGDLNDRLAAPIPMNRFRANIVVSGLPAYQEDEIESFVFPALTLGRVTVCERCIVTTMDQQTGEMGKEPLNTLSKYRKRENHYAGGILFGIYLTGGEGVINVGDTLNPSGND